MAAKRLYAMQDVTLSARARDESLSELVCLSPAACLHACMQASHSRATSCLGNWDWCCVFFSVVEPFLFDALALGLPCHRHQANEVAVLGQLDHRHVVHFLGLCLGPEGSDVQCDVAPYDVFIVQELCDGNLRTFVVMFAYARVRVAVVWRKVLRSLIS